MFDFISNGLPLYMTHFDLFDMPVSLIVDQQLLTRKYADFQQQVQAPGDNGNIDHDAPAKMEKAALINEAYAVLKEPLETIKYVLTLRNLFDETEEYVVSPGFLTELHELNEGIQDHQDSASEENEVKLRQLDSALYEAVRIIIEGYDENVTTEAQLLQVKDYYYKKKYLGGILARIQGIRNIAAEI